MSLIQAQTISKFSAPTGFQSLKGAMLMTGGCGGGPPGQDPWGNKLFDNLADIYEDEEDEEEEDWL